MIGICTHMGRYSLTFLQTYNESQKVKGYPHEKRTLGKKGMLSQYGCGSRYTVGLGLVPRLSELH